MIDASTRERRMTLVRERMAATGVQITAIAPTDNLRYLLGFAPMGDERACMLIVSGDDAAVLVPSLNAEQTADAVPALKLVRWSDDAGPSGALASALQIAGAAGPLRVAVDSEMRADHLLLLQRALPEAEMIDATGVMGPLRAAKDSRELKALQMSANVADMAMLAAFDAITPGVTELAVAEAVAQVFGEHDSSVEFAIVASGSNGAFPHHHTGLRALQMGDAVVIDIGGCRDSYVSDITRMAFVGEPTEHYLEVHSVVEAAVVAGLAASKPGATGAAVDAAARGVIEDAGYGEYFVHRTGHGVGLSGHEPPWIMRGHDSELREGFVHSIEPGIYLPGEFGVRLEDIVRVTGAGCERLSSLSRAVRVTG